MHRAKLLAKRHNKQCDICLLLDATAPKKVKFHCYRDDWDNEKRYICDKCLNGVRELRKKCHQKIDNPHHNVFKTFEPWFMKDIKGAQKKFQKEKAKK